MIEKVNPSHPDKVADRIAGAIVDLAYTKSDNPKVAVELLLGHDNAHIIVESFPGQYKYTISDGTTTYTANSDTYSIDVAANSTVVVTATDTAYLYKLYVDPIK